MVYNIALSIEAEEDIDFIVSYYNVLSDGLGFRFASMINFYFKKIILAPQATSVKYDNVRVKP